MGSARGAHHLRPAWRLLLKQFTSPVMVILIVATLISLVVSDPIDSAIILVIIVASGLLSFAQERRAEVAMADLLGRVQVHADVLRDGREVEVALSDVVVGDTVILRAGDIVPADMRITQATGLLVDESAVTGEAEPAEKYVGLSAETSTLPADQVFFGTHVTAGDGRAIVRAVGADTRFGALVEQAQERDVTTGFEREMRSFGFLLARVVAVLVVIVLAINLLLQRGVVESLMFALAVAVGITPQLLPAIVAVSLSLGARRMAREEVLVTRLDAIEDVGAMTLLCCDKTGTLTEGVVSLDHALDVSGRRSDEVLRLAGLNAHLQAAYPNALDAAIMRVTPVPTARVLAEVPYDFRRRRLSVVVREGESTMLVTKGAYASVLEACTSIRVDGGPQPRDASTRAQVEEHFTRLSGEGYRVLAIATRDLGARTDATRDDECDLVFEGLLAFMDTPDEQARHAIGDLRALHVDVALVTGDNALVAAHVATSVGIPVDGLVTGRDLESMDDAHLAEIVRTTRVFAEIEPLQKRRIVRALQGKGETVGFLGDGINDVAALRAADAGISVQSAADAAKHAAALVVLTKDLAVIAEGIRLGRQTFANTLKYIRVTISANFGNMVSLVIASAFLPFLPLLPVQILLLNLMSDVPALTISTDRVDRDEVESPRQWDLRALRNFMIVFGLVSSVVDLTAFAVLRFGFDADDTTFRSAWFVLSLVTECAALLVLRTGRPAWRSRPGTALVVSSAAVVALGVALPFLAIGGLVGLGPIPLAVLGALGGLALAYVAANEVTKAAWVRTRGWQAM